MIAFPNCKINIGLYITGKRPDGFHNLQSVFYPIHIKDAIEIIDNRESNDIVFTSSGSVIDGSKENNLCFKAYHLLKKDFPSLPAVKIHLHKKIPVGAGLGGGSADAAFTLQLINSKYSLGLTGPQLERYALQLGSDCPFFINNKPCLVSGRGELFKEITVDLSGFKILIVHPGIHINTGWAFSSLATLSAEPNLEEMIAKPVAQWQGLIRNDFEKAIFKFHPGIADVKDDLYTAGAVYASMSGSGSAVFGIFNKETTVNVNFHPDYFYQWA